ncbi:hypothetical protein BD779DRAFT_1790682 [Infundibulicybe gibba]|nr:hypothetical protein BD779DRAFT_1790682 [Infundibulicybe gibba]
MANKRRKLTLKLGRPGREAQSSLTTWNRNVLQKQASLFTMPLDIIFEILGYLSPGELVALGRTNQALRETIYSQGMAMWKSARIAVGAPECAPGFSERQWAILLFGGATCGACGIRNAPTITFSIRRRVCDICMKRNLVSFANFTRKFPDYDPAIIEMAPYTSARGSRVGTSIYDRICWESDLERICKEWERLEADVVKGVENGEENLSAYWDRMTGEAEHIMKHAIICEEWASRVMKKEAEEKRNRRRCAIRERLLALGYEEQDIPIYMLNDPRFHVGELNRAKRLESRRDARLARERNALHHTRMNMLKALYDAYAKSLPPRQWIYLPDIHGLILHSRFYGTIYADSDANITQFSFLPAAAELPMLVPEMISATKAAVTSLLGPTGVEVDEPLDLATSVFEHNFFSYYRSHQSEARGAAMLVRAAGLDPVRATSREMDALNLRFACRDCAEEGLLNSKVGYPWKSAIEHTLASGHMEWRKMTQKDTVRVKQVERYNEANEISWSCSHCTAYFKCPDTKPRVIQHLRDAHEILSPTEPDDVFWYSQHRRHPSWIELASLAIPRRRRKRTARE